MMPPIFIFYHVCLDLPNRDYGFSLVNEQLANLKLSGVWDAAKQIFIGVNGDEEAMKFVRHMAGDKPIVFQNEPEMRPSGEIPTMRTMHEMSKVYDGHRFLYLHTKGASHPPGSPGWEHRRDWRKTMENVVIWRWRECMSHMDRGAESVGNWWNEAPNGSYWAGTFFWATSDFLATLPFLSIEGHHSAGRFEAEVWIGRGPRLPRYVAL